jgi:WD40 repeat protein
VESGQGVRLWDLERRALLRGLETGGSGVSDIAFTPDGSRLVGSLRDGAVRVWSVATGEERLALRTTPTARGSPPARGIDASLGAGRSLADLAVEFRADPGLADAERSHLMRSLALRAGERAR